MATMEELHRAILAGGLVIDTLTIATIHGSSGMVVRNQVWSPNGRGRILLEEHNVKMPWEYDVIHAIVNGIQMTDWARRSWHMQQPLGLEV